MKIEEVIVVEGRSDTVAIRRAVKADTIETGGSALNADVMNRIRLAQQKRGVIVFTDPDYAGERIRKLIQQAVPGCKHAFLPREEAEKKGKAGVEHASPESIRKALEGLKTEATSSLDDPVSQDDLLEAGLVGGVESKARRMEIGNRLGIGYTNGKQLLKRLNTFLITRDAFWSAVEELDGSTKEGERND